MTVLITPGVSVSGMVRNLANVFSTGSTFMSELIQNARRAGATDIHVACIQDDEALHVMVNDNGCGIDDFQKLLMLAESGWDETVTDNESPFGMGFFSALLVGEETQILSKGKLLRVSRENLLAGKSFVFEPGEDMTGSRIYIRKNAGKEESARSRDLFFNDLIRTAKREASWIGANVTLNGELLSRGVYDVLNLSDSSELAVLPLGENGELGTLRIKLDEPLIRSIIYLCDGSILAEKDGYRPVYEAPINAQIVSINPKQMKMRMPDREQFVDHENAVKKIEAEIKKAVVKRFKEDVDSMGDVDAYLKWVMLLERSSYGWWSDVTVLMLNELSFIPKSFTFEPNLIDPMAMEEHRYRKFGERNSENAIGITRCEIESGDVPVADIGWSRAVLGITKALNWHAVDCQLFSTKHWLVDALKRAGNPCEETDERFLNAISSIEGVNVIGTYTGGWYGHTYTLADSYNFLWCEEVVQINFGFRCYNRECVWMVDYEDISTAAWDERNCSDSMSEGEAEDQISTIDAYFRSIGKKDAALLKAALDSGTLHVGYGCKAVFIDGKFYNIKAEATEAIMAMLEPLGEAA